MMVIFPEAGLVDPGADLPLDAFVLDHRAEGAVIRGHRARPGGPRGAHDYRHRTSSEEGTEHEENREFRDQLAHVWKVGNA